MSRKEVDGNRLLVNGCRQLRSPGRVVSLRFDRSEKTGPSQGAKIASRGGFGGYYSPQGISCEQGLMLYLSTEQLASQTVDDSVHVVCAR